MKVKKRDYREKTVEGIIFGGHGFSFKKCNVTVRMTSDQKGQSLSMQAFNILVEVPLEPLKDIIKVAEKEQA